MKAVTSATPMGVADFQVSGSTPGRGPITNGFEDISQVGAQAVFDASFSGNYVLGTGIDGPGAGSISTGSLLIFGANSIPIIMGGNGTIFGVPFYTGNAASILNPSLITISVYPAPVLVSGASGGGKSNGRSDGPAMSADGRFLGFVSSATNLLATGNPSVSAIYSADACRGVGSTCTPSVSVVSVADNGSLPTLACGESLQQPVAVSQNGRYYAFDCSSINMVSSPVYSGDQVFLRDTCVNVATGCTPHTYLISQSTGGVAANGGANAVSISPNGRFVAFTSAATNLAPNSNGIEDVFFAPTGLP